MKTVDKWADDILTVFTIPDSINVPSKKVAVKEIIRGIQKESIDMTVDIVVDTIRATKKELRKAGL